MSSILTSGTSFQGSSVTASGKKSGGASREARLAAALRENLKRRKTAAGVRGATVTAGQNNDTAKPVPDGRLKPAAKYEH